MGVGSGGVDGLEECVHCVVTFGGFGSRLKVDRDDCDGFGREDWSAARERIMQPGRGAWRQGCALAS